MMGKVWSECEWIFSFSSVVFNSEDVKNCACLNYV